MLELLLIGVSAALLLATLVARLHLRWWWIRSFEFPRVQIAFGALVFTLAPWILLDPGPECCAATLVALAALVLQVRNILPWTRLWPIQVNTAQDAPKEQTVTFMVANVLTTNHHSELLIEQIHAQQPDIILTLESDQWWQEHLDNALDAHWPYNVKVPLDNLYGMHLYSRLPLSGSEVKWLIQDDIPSIHTYITLESGDKIRLYAVHPRPPAPSESEKSLWRDAELLWVGKEIHKDPRPTLVAGDLNDVAWSQTTREFCRVGGMLDPRRGRGMFSTFHAKYPFLRWPLDHIFVTEHFTLVSMRRLNAFGSDHFPILATFCYRPERQDEHETPSASQEERQEASETIAAGKSETQQTEPHSD